MAVPDWRTLQAGTRVRAAVWLHSEVGVGGTFTKAQLRTAFPGVEQVDRRMRDLRPDGWVITTYREDASLDSDELRLVAEGGPVWEKGYRSRQERKPTEQERRAVFAADNFACVYCGLAGGEPYPDDELRSAKLSAARAQSLDGEGFNLITLCDRCWAGARGEVIDVSFIGDAAALNPEQLSRLAAWVRAGRRAWSPEEQLWARYQRLPAAQRDEVKATLRAR